MKPAAIWVAFLSFSNLVLAGLIWLHWAITGTR